MFPDLPDVTRFARILRWIKAWFNVLPLDEAARLLPAGRLPERAAAITFDDGYADNVTVALPLLAKTGLPATFFIASGYLDGGCMWNDAVIAAIRAWPGESFDGAPFGLGRYGLSGPADRRRAVDACIDRMKYRPAADRRAQAHALAAAAKIAVPSDLMMTSEGVRVLHRAGMTIGAHTVTHPILRKLPDAEARDEIERGRQRLEVITGSRVGLFAYPNGRRGEDYDERHVRIVRETGFDAAVSTNPGAGGAASDLMELPRFTPWDRRRLGFCARLAHNLVEARRAGTAAAPAVTRAGSDRSRDPA
jgi:peptidoglycan/xylan/chitin deacetylase (PgdA/CDA1 family)